MISKKFRIKALCIFLGVCIIFSGFLPMIQNAQSFNNINNSANNANWTDYLFLDDVTETEYYFTAEDESYILIEIDNIDYTSFKLDNVEYELSYGQNVLKVDFQDLDVPYEGYPVNTHLIEIDQFKVDNGYFKSITVEPIFLAEGSLETDLEVNSLISFKAGCYSY